MGLFDEVVEPGDDAELKGYLKTLLPGSLRRTMWAGIAFLAAILSVVPFSAGHSLHNHWEPVGKILVILCELLMLVFLYFVLMTGYVLWDLWKAGQGEKKYS